MLQADELKQLQDAAALIHASPALIEYVQALAEYTRRSSQFVNGLSPRATLGMLAAARAWALLEGRPHVLPEDVQAILPGIVAHRLHAGSELGGMRGDAIGQHLIEAVPLS
jgi:MoxR-like ATPase